MHDVFRVRNDDDLDEITPMMRSYWNFEKMFAVFFSNFLVSMENLKEVFFRKLSGVILHAGIFSGTRRRILIFFMLFNVLQQQLDY